MSEMKRRQGGFSYLFLLFLVALLGVTLVASTQASWIESKRDKEAELLFAGHEIRKAIDSYYKATPTRPGAGAQALAQISRADARQDSMQPAENSGVVLPKGEYPRQIEDLLEDRRFTPPLRHLRRQYVEPVTGSMEWGLVQEGGRIIGVYSRSLEKPLKKANFPEGYDSFMSARRYSDWVFAAVSHSTVPAGVIRSANGISPEGGLASPLQILESSPAVAPTALGGMPSESANTAPESDTPPPDMEHQRECGIQYLQALRSCRGNADCVSAAQESRQACLAGG